MVIWAGEILWKRYRSTTWRKVFCDLCAVLVGSVKHLYGASESDNKLGSGMTISCGQKVEKNLICSSNLPRDVSSDLVDCLTIPFGSVGGSQVNVSKSKLPAVYKKPSPTSDEGRTHDH